MPAPVGRWEALLPFAIRTARPEDAADIARVETEVWRDTYPLLLPDAFLVAGFDRAARIRGWRRRLNDKRQET